jgi:hypothetical protein
MTKETSDSALAFVGDIMTAYRAAMKVEGDALRAALECGKYLNLAFENVEAAKGKGKWNAWRKQNLPAVSEETDRIYRRLAEAVAQKEDFFAKCKSIRDAIKHRAKYDDDLVLKPEQPSKPRGGKRTGSGAAGLTPPEPAIRSGGLEAELENAAADDIVNNLADDTDKLEEVAQRSIAKLSPDKVCDALTQAWTPDQLRDLRTRLTAYLTAQANAPQDTPSAPVRRSTLEMPSLS